MLKMLIVEDERFEREGLLDFLDWAKLGIEIAAIACDGIEGLELAEKVHPDLIITDIKMPGMDGIQMLKRIKTFLPAVKIIILTGYDDFQFAREAINLNADGYVLKPVEEKELLAALTKLIVESERQKKTSEEHASLKAQIQENLPVIRNKFTLDLLEGRLKPEDINSQLLQLGFKFAAENFVALAVKLPRENPIARDAARMQAPIGDFIEGPCLIVTPEGEGGETLLGLPLPGEPDGFLNSFTADLHQKINEQYGLAYVLGIGEYCISLGGLHESCRQARQALQFGLFWRCLGVVYYQQVADFENDFSGKISEFLVTTSNFSKQILYSIRSSDPPGVFTLLDECFSYLHLHKGAGKDFIDNYLNNQMNETALFLLSFHNHEGIDSDQHYFRRKLALSDNIQSLREVMIEFYQRVFSYLNERRNNNDEATIKKVIQLIEMKYMSDINLKTIAGEVFLSPNYLGNIFKKVTGKTFNDYLQEYRMEKAKELLKSAKNKVARVAQEVGIPNTSYFCLVFKHTYGMTPGEYQELAIRN